MKRVFFFTVLASVAFAGCTFDEGVSDGAVNGNEINFAVAQYTPQTRAEHDPDAAFNENITIWSWYDGKNTEVIPGDDYNPSAGEFDDGRKYYWPVDGSALDFVAVPTTLKGSAYFTAPGRDAAGATALTFVVPVGNNYHSTNIMTTEVKTANSGTVDLLFRHLLSKINIKVTQKERESTDARWLVTVNDIKVTGLECAGEVVIKDSWDATDGNKLWDTTSGGETWQVTNTDQPLYASIGAGASETPYVSAETYYMLPQTLKDGVQKITIEYTIETDYLGNPTQPNTVETYSKTFDLKGATSISKWFMNKVITYNIAIDPTETLSPIAFTVKEEEWGVESGSAPDVDPIP